MPGNSRSRITAALLIMIMLAGFGGWLGGASLSPREEAQDANYFHIGAASAGGVYFSVGEALAALISRPPGAESCDATNPCGVTGLVGIAEVSDGSVGNLVAVNNGQIQSALAQADLVYGMVRGVTPLGRGERLRSVRAIANLYPEDFHFLVNVESGISGFSGIKGKRISLGREGSGSRATAMMVLKSYGLSLEDVNIVQEDPGRSADMLAAGQLDAMLYVGGYPALGLMDAFAAGKVRLLPLNDAVIEQMLKLNRSLHASVIPAGAYAGLTENVPTIAVNAQWIVNSAVDEETIYQITRALWDERNHTILLAGHPQAARIKPETALQDITIPLHPGALRYYREEGLLPAAGPVMSR